MSLKVIFPPLQPQGEEYNDLVKYPPGTKLWAMKDGEYRGYHLKLSGGWSYFVPENKDLFRDGDGKTSGKVSCLEFRED